jgi:hypothetical protein
VERLPRPKDQDAQEDDYFAPPPHTQSSEDDFIKDIGKFSAISSSKQQPLSAVLDELHYRCSTEDV